MYVMVKFIDWRTKVAEDRTLVDVQIKKWKYRRNQRIRICVGV